MIYFPFHVGDWITGTKLMSALEKGVYMDLLTYYYSVERAITEDECRRIARAYTDAEQDAMQYVLQNHFAYVDGAYVHTRCEEVIAQTLEKQTDIRAKKQKAAQARWKKERERKLAQAQNADGYAPAHADAEQMDSKRNADAMLTNNHNPITNISTTVDKKEKIKKEKKSKPKTVLSKPDDVSSEQIWSDFIALRNARHAPLTETALNIIRKEAGKAGISLEQALETCCMRGWQGFKAEWYHKQNNSRFQSYGPRDLEPEFRPEDYEGGLISDLMQR